MPQIQYLLYWLFQTNKHPISRQSQMLVVSEYTLRRKILLDITVLLQCLKGVGTQKSNGNFSSSFRSYSKGSIPENGMKEMFFPFVTSRCIQKCIICTINNHNKLSPKTLANWKIIAMYTNCIKVSVINQWCLFTHTYSWLRQLKTSQW